MGQGGGKDCSTNHASDDITRQRWITDDDSPMDILDCSDRLYYHEYPHLPVNSV